MLELIFLGAAGAMGAGAAVSELKNDGTDWLGFSRGNPNEEAAMNS